MFSISAVKGKFKRSQINFKNTYLWDDMDVIQKQQISIFLRIHERGIIYYNQSDSYYWFLTDQRIIMKESVCNLNELVKVDFLNIKNNPHEKISNKELTLFTKSSQFDLFVEEGSWHLFYNIFKFIISKNTLIDSEREISFFLTKKQ